MQHWQSKIKKDSSELAEMFSIELKFTIDCLKFWYNRNLKQTEPNENLKDEFIQNTPKKHVAFAIFRLKVKQRMVGLIMSARLNIYF